MSEPRLKIGKLSDFVPQRENANRHTPRGMSLLEASMQQDGYVAPMTAAADGEVIDGSARHETAVEVFSPDAEALVVEHDGTRPIVMKRVDVPSADDERAKRIAVRANRIGQLNLDFDPEIVEKLRFEIPELGPLWTDEEMKKQFSPSEPELKEESLADVDTLKSQFMVLVECKSEAEQNALLERLLEEGYQCRALIS